MKIRAVSYGLICTMVSMAAFMGGCQTQHHAPPVAAIPPTDWNFPFLAQEPLQAPPAPKYVDASQDRTDIRVYHIGGLLRNRSDDGMVEDYADEGDFGEFDGGEGGE